MSGEAEINAAQYSKKNKTVDELRALEMAFLKKDISPEEIDSIYKEWSIVYDEPKLVIWDQDKTADMLAELLEEGNRADARVLDVGAGTGLVGQRLKQQGFVYIDALDASPFMLEQAKQKDIYENFITTQLGPDRLDIDDDTYDHLVSCGAFYTGHIPNDCLGELIRITKPGGKVLISTAIQSQADVDANHVPYIHKLQEEGRWRLLQTRQDEHFYSDFKGFFFVCEVTK